MKRQIFGVVLALMIVTGGVTASAQSDTLVVRRDTIDILRGVMGGAADTVSVSVDTSALFDSPRLVPEDYFRSVGEGRVSVETASKKKTSGDLIAEGDSLKAGYEFEKALERYIAADALSPGSGVASKKIEEVRNALNMTELFTLTKPVAKALFSVYDFFLFYPMSPVSWRPSPNSLDSSSQYPVYATYVPQGSESVYYSASDPSGVRNLYFSSKGDSLWSAPRLLDERLTTSGNEIFPVLSRDKKRLYFASDGLYGMGGYDLYYSDWDEYARRWGEPVNMGFPYSSPADDFLLMDTMDGKYTIFASTRESPKDSVCIYVLEYQSNPDRVKIASPEERRSLSSLSPVNDPTRIDAGSAVRGSIPHSDEMRLYSETASRISEIRDSIYLVESSIDALRSSLLSGAGNPGEVGEAIALRQGSLKPLRDSLSAAEARLKIIEDSFLHKGTGAGNGRLKRSADRQVVGAGSAYTFSKNPFGPPLDIRLAAAAPAEAGSEFRISSVGRFAYDKQLPEGIVYQIHIFTRSSHASLDDLSGLSPVYERLTYNLRYSYSAGVFRSYPAALSRLNDVRALGFEDAYIEAYKDGKEITLDAAFAASRE